MQTDFIKLINWSQQFNHLPWRQHRSLYTTLVSEIMLQQTTVPTVLNKFPQFITTYPDLSKLAKASEEEILIAWSGLGYYRRAKNLLAAAKFINNNHNGQIPTDYTSLVVIPGIGDYTANALLSIGNNQRSLAIDTNIERVVTRYYGLNISKGAKLKEYIKNLFKNNKILDFDISYRDLNESLMDLGREYCTNKKAECHICPLATNCKSIDDPLARPSTNAKKPVFYNLSLLRVLIKENNKLWCYKKNENEWLTNQWECPTFILASEDEKLKQYPLVVLNYKTLKSFKTTITKYKITNYILELSIEDFRNDFNWERELFTISISHFSNMSTATHKALVAVSSTVT